MTTLGSRVLRRVCLLIVPSVRVFLLVCKFAIRLLLCCFLGRRKAYDVHANTSFREHRGMDVQVQPERQDQFPAEWLDGSGCPAG